MIGASFPCCVEEGPPFSADRQCGRVTCDRESAVGAVDALGSLAVRSSFRVECGVVRLVELLKRHEGKTLEFKRDLSSPEGVLRCLVAFANTAGGIVVIGVEDGSKNVRVPDVLASEKKLAGIISETIRPRLRISWWCRGGI